MNNLNIYQNQTTFSFLAIQPKTQTSANGCGLAWIENYPWTIKRNNYYFYTCHSCPRIQIKKGQPAKEVLNWGGIND